MTADREALLRALYAAFTERDDGTVEVAVSLVVRDPAGMLLDRSAVRHVHTFAGDLVARMDVEA